MKVVSFFLVFLILLKIASPSELVDLETSTAVSSELRYQLDELEEVEDGCLARSRRSCHDGLLVCSGKCQSGLRFCAGLIYAFFDSIASFILNIFVGVICFLMLLFIFVTSAFS